MLNYRKRRRRRKFRDAERRE